MLNEVECMTHHSGIEQRRKLYPSILGKKWAIIMLYELLGEIYKRYKVIFSSIKPNRLGNINECCLEHSDCYKEQKGQEYCDNTFCECLVVSFPSFFGYHRAFHDQTFISSSDFPPLPTTTMDDCLKNVYKSMYKRILSPFVLNVSHLKKPILADCVVLKI
ncbi:unnamed protein product [Angiostrongylus costaricensis]|uniref:RNase H domain-containing protein n=1 Tax=Angiostrongylus costaricensis TaxID=334426 RepID=A0A0R3PS17_ANGCS|nr:unnamed protein product [Angiostrongylus costaricensis]